MVSRLARWSGAVIFSAALQAGSAKTANADEDAPEKPEPAGEVASGTGPAETQKSPEPARAPTPALRHAPPSTAEPHAALVIVADIAHPDPVRRVLVVYRRDGGTWQETPFRRGAPGPYAARIPAAAVQWPAVEYTIEIETVDGRRLRSFASREAPFRVLVPEDLMDVRERVLLDRLEGRRSVISSSAELVHFGESSALVARGDGTTGVERVSDRYYRIESAYTYRPLRLVNEFSVRVGIVRGQSPVPGVEDPEDFKVGLNYAAPSVRLRLADLAHLEGQFLTSVTEVGFSLGVGGALHIGDVYGSKLVLGFESIEVFGTRFFSRVDVRASDRLRLSPIVEATDMPHADRYGVRLIGEAAYQLGGGFEIGARGGYQARDAASGGPSGGVHVAWAL
jgi:hypothetical protein